MIARPATRRMHKFAHQQRIANRLEGIASDTRRGASELAALAVAVFDVAAPAKTASAGEYVTALQRLSRDIAALRPAMAPIQNSVARLFYDVLRRSARTSDANTVFTHVRTASREMKRRLAETDSLVTGHFRRRFSRKKRPIIISYSSQVIHSLAAAGKNRLDIIVCESRPAFEGRRTARRARDFARSVTLITEAQIGLAMKRADCVVLGSDAVHPNGSIRNKVGSRVLALAAKDERRTVIVLANRYKMLGASGAVPETHPPREVWPSAPPDIRVENDYFESVPASLVSYIVMEDGVYRPAELRTLWRTSRKYGAALTKRLGV